MGPTTHGVKTIARQPAHGRPRWPDWPGRDPDASATHASARQRQRHTSARQCGTCQRQRPPGTPAPHERERERPPLIVRPDTSARPLSLSAFSPGTIRLRIPSACARIIARQSVRNIERR